MRSAKLPPDLGAMNPRLREWMQQHLERAARPVTEVTFTFPLADTEYRVRHKLPVIPTGYRVIRRNKAGTVYTATFPDAPATVDSVEKPFDKYYIYLKCDLAATTVVLEVS